MAGAMMGQPWKVRSLLRLSAVCWLASVSGPVTADDVWIDIDTDSRSLTVMDEDNVLRVFENISVGRNGVTSEKVVKDRKTPLGSYRVRRINEDSRFHIFFGFDYPNLQQSQSAFRAGRINYDQLKSIRKAHYLRREPPSDTPLGGLIGIHGLGDGDPAIHEEYNWTDGCIALTNEDVDELAGWIRLGTRVEVH
jgi:lipoprotein-anchoring transpeptidase ErfK/SrfK